MSPEIDGPTRNKYSSLLIRLALVGLTLAAVIMMLRAPGELRSYLNSDMLWTILVSQVFAVIANACFGLRLVIIAGQPVRYWRAGFESVTLSIGLNALLPARLSELVKPAILSLRAGTPGPAALSALVIERAWDVVILGGLTLVTLWLYPDVGTVVRQSAFAILLLACACLGFFWYKAAWVNRLIAWMERAGASATASNSSGLKSRILRFAPTFLEALQEGVQNRRAIAGLGLGVLGWSSSWAMVGYLLVTLGPIPIGPAEVSAVFILSLLGGMIAILPAGFGTFHASATFGMILIGYPQQAAIALAVALHLQAFVFALAFTAGFALTQKIALREVLSRLK
jgi:hypothetical protein